MFIALARRDKVVKQHLNCYIALGPVAWVGKIKSKMLLSLANNISLIDGLIALKINQFLAYNDGKFIPLLCKYDS